MRVTHVITRLIIGGAQENTVASVLGLNRHSGWETDLISGPTKTEEGSLAPQFQNCPDLLTIVPSLIRPIHPLFDLMALNRLTKIFRSTKPAIVHTHSGKAGIVGRLAAARAGVPIIVHTVHGPSFGNFQGPLANFIFRRAELSAAKVTTHFVGVSQAMIHQYLAAGIGTINQYTRIFSGFPIEDFLNAQNDLELRRHWNIAPDDLVIGKIARLFKLKGHDDLISIAPQLIKRCPKIKFLLVGGGPWRDRLQKRVTAQHLQNYFVFTGPVPPKEIPRYLGVMDFLVHLSRREGLARVLPQALAAGRPVISYDCDGASEVCVEDETGFLIPPGNLSLLSQRVEQLANDPILRHRLAARGRSLVLENFSEATMVEKLIVLYKQLTAAKGL